MFFLCLCFQFLTNPPPLQSTFVHFISFVELKQSAFKSGYEIELCEREKIKYFWSVSLKCHIAMSQRFE